MNRRMLTLAALLLTAALLFLFPRLTRPPEEKKGPLSVTRVWIAAEEPALGAWLRKRAAAFEKETGARLYVRAATREECDAASRGDAGIVRPDLMVRTNQGEIVALKGYALILRDDSAPVLSPAPTSALFFRPSPAPGPSPSPAPTPDARAFTAILAPRALPLSLPGILPCDQPLADFIAKKAPAAVLSAGEAAQLPFGYQAYALPDGEGFMAYGAAALTEPGKAFGAYLQNEASQRALGSHGLYAPDLRLRLYGEESPLRALIESGRRE